MTYFAFTVYFSINMLYYNKRIKELYIFIYCNKVYVGVKLLWFIQHIFNI